MEDIEAIKFIDKLYRDLYLSDEVLHHSTSDKTDKYRNIKEYLEMLKDMHERASISDHRKEILKRMYHDKYVIKPEDIPESFYEAQKRIALERGYGHVEIDEIAKKEYQKQIINDQKKSLDVWLDYFLSDDAKIYPFWAKYWAFQGMLKLGTYNKEKGTFNRRTKDTTSIFADLNNEALALSIDMMIKVLNKESIEDKDLEVLLKGGSFQRIYTYILNKTLADNSNITKRDEGRWVKYEQGSDPRPLVNSLQGYNTGWCTAGSSVAEIQLQGGDFYVYYTLDENGEYKVPRIAIRMQDNEIGEIRGVATGQNLEPEMENVVTEKIKYFPDRDKYYKKVNNMKRLTAIYNDNKEHKELSIEDLRFLYEVDEKIVGFGYQEDPRIKEILHGRNHHVDLSKIFDCKPEEIAMNSDSVNSNTKVCYGSMDLHEYEILKIKKFPETIVGDLILNSIKEVKNIILPKTVTGSVQMEEVVKIKNVKFPEYVGKNVYLSSLKILDQLILPKVIEGSLYLIDLISSKNIIFPDVVRDGINLTSLEDAKNLVLPQKEVGTILLNRLRSAKTVTFPKRVNGVLSLKSLNTTEGLVLPEEVDKWLYLNSIPSVEGLKLPKKVGGSICMDTIKSIKGLKLPEGYNNSLFLAGLKDTEGLNLPEEFGGTLDLSGLESLEGVNLPNIIHGDLYLEGVKNLNNYVFPEVIEELHLNNIVETKGITLPKQFKSLYMKSLKKADKFVFPKEMNCINLKNLTTIDKLILPESIKYGLDIGKLVNVKELVLPKSISKELIITKELFYSIGYDKIKDIVYGDIYVRGATEEELWPFMNMGNSFMSRLSIHPHSR